MLDQPGPGGCVELLWLHRRQQRRLDRREQPGRRHTGERQRRAISRYPTPGDATLKVWDVATKTEKRAMSPTEAPRCGAVSTDGKYLALGSNLGKIKVLDTTTWKEVVSLAEHNKSVFRVSFSPDGKTISAANEDGSVSVVRIPETK